ncbi:MAG TPA: FAD-dependent oxidoreductase [Dehalococcoidia bacterium]|nr:FAD-dependent oxidoreductase [Dehalococcoidia bacterium]
MRDVNYLIIGGGLASIRAARQIRKGDPDGSILVAGEEPDLPYDRPPLSKEFLAGDKTSEEILLEPHGALSDMRIEMALGQPAVRLDAAGMLALLSNGEQIHFERALIATGGRPIRLAVPGADLAGVHYLRTIADARAIAADATPGRKAVVVGGGFIGIEVAATLRKRGLDVTVLEALPRIWARFGNEDLSNFVQGYCQERGVQFLTGSAISELRGRDRVESVVTAAGKELPCDLVCIGVGIRPNVELATDAGLDVENGIVVDQGMRTSHPDIYAAGDVINYYDPISGRRRRVEHWGHAEYSGQIAGANMAGGAEVYNLLSYVWSDIFDLHLEFAGDEDQHDAALLRGDPKDGSFMILYVKDGKLTAFFAINAPPREFAGLRRLIQTHKDISGEEETLRNPQSNLRSLL